MRSTDEDASELTSPNQTGNNSQPQSDSPFDISQSHPSALVCVLDLLNSSPVPHSLSKFLLPSTDSPSSVILKHPAPICLPSSSPSRHHKAFAFLPSDSDDESGRPLPNPTCFSLSSAVSFTSFSSPTSKRLNPLPRTYITSTNFSPSIVSKQHPNRYLSLSGAFDMSAKELDTASHQLERSPATNGHPRNGAAFDDVEEEEEPLELPPPNQYRPSSSLESHNQGHVSQSIESSTQSTEDSIPASQRPEFLAQTVALQPTQILDENGEPFANEMVPTQIATLPNSPGSPEPREPTNSPVKVSAAIEFPPRLNTRQIDGSRSAQIPVNQAIDFIIPRYRQLQMGPRASNTGGATDSLDNQIPNQVSLKETHPSPPVNDNEASNEVENSATSKLPTSPTTITNPNPTRNLEAFDKIDAQAHSSEFCGLTPKNSRKYKRKEVETTSNVPVKKRRLQSDEAPPEPATNEKDSQSLLKPTIVFALWTIQDGFYYSGTIVGRHPSQSAKYYVNFDDGISSVVDLKNMRQCVLAIGDKVTGCNKARAKSVGVVTAIDCWESEGYATVVFGSETVQLKRSEIRIKKAWIDVSWSERLIDRENIRFEELGRELRKPLSKHKAYESKQTRVSRPPSAGDPHGMFHKIGFIISLSPKSLDWETKKETLASKLTAMGGQVLDDWTDVFSMDGRISGSGKRWNTEVESVRYTLGGVDRVFVLAEEHTTKPKYLFALACGIPCLNTNFMASLDDSEWPNWRYFMLPAGRSKLTGRMLSQRYNYEWDTEESPMKKLLEERREYGAFSKQTVLFIGDAFVPQRTGRKMAHDKTKEAFSALPKLAFALGAEAVEAVVDARWASNPLPSYQVLITMDNAPKITVENKKSLDVSDLKELIIAGIARRV